jgi:hypothetical protein
MGHHLMIHRFKTMKKGLLTALLAILSMSLHTYAREELSEEQVKAAFIFNFAKFVEWPTHSFEEENSSVNLCIAGQDKVEVALKLLEQREVQSRVLKIIALNDDINQIKAKGCHILFIARSEKNRQAQWLSVVEQQPVLTVADNLDLVKQGGMISLYLEAQRVQFVVNQSITQNNGLKLSARMLQLARVPK